VTILGPLWELYFHRITVFDRSFALMNASGEGIPSQVSQSIQLTASGTSYVSLPQTARPMDRMGLILELLNDPAFVEFELEQESPSIFNAVGRTHTETWHSALLGWLLDPNASHGLGHFPLRRLLLVMRQEATASPCDRGVDLAELLSRDGILTGAQVRPNEQDLQEVTVPNVGRLDILVSGLAQAPYGVPPFKEVEILVEVKVNDTIGVEQCKRYMSHARQKRANGVLVIPVFVAREERLQRSSADLFGDPDWIKVHYQTIYDDIIEPCLRHPTITAFGSSTLKEYVKTLKSWQNGGRPMITTKREKELVAQLRTDHYLAIKALYEILSEESEDFPPLTEDSGTPAEPMRLKIGAKTIEGGSVPELYRNALRCLIDGKHLEHVELPFASGAKRYLLARQPIHPLGNPFRRPIDIDGFYMESHKSRDQAVGDLLKFCQANGIPMSVLSS